MRSAFHNLYICCLLLGLSQFLNVLMPYLFLSFSLYCNQSHIFLHVIRSVIAISPSCQRSYHSYFLLNLQHILPALCLSFIDVVVSLDYCYILPRAVPYYLRSFASSACSSVFDLYSSNLGMLHFCLHP